MAHHHTDQPRHPATQRLWLAPCFMGGVFCSAVQPKFILQDRCLAAYTALRMRCLQLQRLTVPLASATGKYSRRTQHFTLQPCPGRNSRCPGRPACYVRIHKDFTCRTAWPPKGRAWYSLTFSEITNVSARTALLPVIVRGRCRIVRLNQSITHGLPKGRVGRAQHSPIYRTDFSALKAVGPGKTCVVYDIKKFPQSVRPGLWRGRVRKVYSGTYPTILSYYSARKGPTAKARPP